MHKRGFSLVEIVTVIAIIGIGSAIFYSTFMLNWRALDDELTRLNLWQDVNSIMERITDDGRASRNINVTAAPNIVTAAFILPDGSTIDYNIRSDGVLDVTENGVTFILARNVDFGSSVFVKMQDSLRFDLTLGDDVFGRKVTVSTSRQIFAWCVSCV